MVMIASDDLTFLAHIENGPHGFDGFGTIADHVAQAVDRIHPLLVDIRQNGIQSRHVAVDVADDRDAPHADGRYTRPVPEAP